MENKINLVELLKDCPEGMELDCTMYNKVTLLSVDGECTCYPIRVKREDGNSITLTKYGQYTDADFAKCVIFPKGRTTWEGFVPPCKFKDGDIIYIKDKHNNWCSIMNKCEDGKLYTYADICFNSNTIYCNKPNILCACSSITEYRLATEEEKQKLFDAIKTKGYKWNAETKTLEKLIEPKFKVGDKVRHKITNRDDIYEISKVYDDSYGLVDFTWMIYMKHQDLYELVPNKFDINTLVPFESKVLVRDCNSHEWEGEIFTRYDNKSFNNCNFVTLSGRRWKQCIPYEGNEHLLGKTDDCDDFYKNWN